jgi:hypothetical protein
MPLIVWNNLFKRLNPTERLLYGITLFVEFWIEPEGPHSFRISPGSPIDWNIALNSLLPVVLANFLGIVGCICGDNRGTILHFEILKYFEGWLIELRIIGICG